MRFFFVFSLLLFTSSALRAQALTGTVTDKEGTPIGMASILIKEAGQSQNILEFVQAKGGKYSLKLTRTYQRLCVEATAFSHTPDSVIIENPQKDSTYTLNFKLLLVVQDLKEVVVIGKRKPYEVKEDTVSYNVSAYRDGTERKIEDIIKKLPGIKVNENTGQIEYKGKPVEAVTLEGDDLFGQNYTIGTKNINVDMVEQVQAIDNYTANPLLKGIEEGGKVSLNLKLKKGKFDFSGSISAGVGLASGEKFMRSAHSSLLGISRNYKSFGSFSHNNMGINNSPFDYFGGTGSIERLMAEDNYYADKVIPESSFGTLLGNDRANINNQVSGSHHLFFRVGKRKRLSVKNNLYFLTDDIFAYQLSTNQNTIGGQTFMTSDERSTHKRPLQYRGDLEMKYNTSKTSLLEYTFRVSQESIQTPMQTRMNGTEVFDSRLSSRDFYLRQKMLFTKKLGSKRALQLNALQTTNRVPQVLTFAPSVLNPDSAKTDRQESRAQKDFLEAKATLLGAVGPAKYTLSAGFIQNKNPYKSLLTSIFSVSNDLTYLQQSAYQRASYLHSYRKWQMKVAYEASYLYQEITGLKENQKQGRIVREPSLGLSYKASKWSKINGQVSYNQNPLTENNLFENEVLINNRSLITNAPNLQLQNQTVYSLNYLHHNMDKFFRLTAIIMYQESVGGFFSNLTVKERTTQTNSFFLPVGTDNLSFNFMTGKYFTGLGIDMTLNGSYMVSNYKNILNDSDLRTNQMRSLTTSMDLGTSFLIPVNFKNSVSYNRNESSNAESGTFRNDFLSNSSKIIFAPNKALNVSLISDYYVPSLQKMKENYWFLDFYVSYNPQKSKFSWAFSANNLLNKTVFKQVQTSDFATTTFESNLLPRYFMAYIEYRF